MTTVQLHDAIGLLPVDLIDETDCLRCRKQQRLHWQRYAAMAAAAVLVICGGVIGWRLLPGTASKTAAAPEAAQFAAASATVADEALPGAQAPMADTAGADNGSPNLATAASLAVHYAATPALTEAAQTQPTYVALMTSLEDWQTYRQQQEGSYDLTQLDTVMDSRDEGYFEYQDLVLIRLDASTSAGPAVQNMVWEEGSLEICLNNTATEEDADQSCWHIALDVEKGALADADQIQLITQ